MINIIATTQAEYLGEKLKGDKDFNIIFTGKNRENARYFPDGEVYVKLPGASQLRGRIVILHTGAPKPNAGLAELKMVLEILKQNNSGPIEIFFTYFPFCMQDHIKDEGETNTAENIIRELVNYYQVKKIYIIDAHFSNKEWMKKYPVININVSKLLIDRALADYPDLVTLAPDIGSQLRIGIQGAEKERKNSFEVNIKSDKDFQNLVKGKTIGAVDDLLETGETMSQFYDECKKYGAERVIAIITHGVLESGIKRVRDKYEKLYLTNSINREEANIDLINEIIKILKK